MNNLLAITPKKKSDPGGSAPLARPMDTHALHVDRDPDLQSSAIRSSSRALLFSTLKSRALMCSRILSARLISWSVFVLWALFRMSCRTSCANLTASVQACEQLNGVNGTFKGTHSGCFYYSVVSYIYSKIFIVLMNIL